jgi:hypothetical protein
MCSSAQSWLFSSYVYQQRQCSEHISYGYSMHLVDLAICSAQLMLLMWRAAAAAAEPSVLDCQQQGGAQVSTQALPAGPYLKKISHTRHYRSARFLCPKRQPTHTPISRATTHCSVSQCSSVPVQSISPDTACGQRCLKHLHWLH